MLENQDDWRKYEDYTTQILNDERVHQYIEDYFGLYDLKVKPKDKLDGKKTGTKWEVDAYGYDINNQLTLIECKHYKSRFVEQNTIAAFAYIIQDIGARRGIIVTTLGLQSGAIKVAQAESIGLIQLHRNSTDSNFFVSFKLPEEHLGTSVGSFTDQFSGISAVTIAAEATTYLPTREQYEKIIERLQERENRTNFSNEEIFQEMRNLQNEMKQ
jgi:hypothetical protein